MDTFESTVLKKYRRLSQFLIISSLVNVAFISSAIYQYFRPTKSIDVSVSKNPLTEDAQTVLKSFFALNYQDLMTKLSQKVQIEPGLFKRDLALAMLVDSYHIDLQRALSKQNISFQQILFQDAGKQKWLNVPRGLADGDFELIQQFLKQEAWPLTAKGLFLKLKFGIKDPQLDLAFYKSQDFSKLFDALSLKLSNFKQDALVTMLTKGDFLDFELFHQCVMDGGFSAESFLHHYAKLGSFDAANLLIDMPHFTVKSLADSEALDFLDVLSANKEKQKKIALELLSSFRSDQFKQEVKKRGFEAKEEPIVATVSLEKKPANQKAAQEKAKPAQKQKSQKTYVVQEGDSLWKISRKFKVEIEAIKQANRLESESLKPGRTLIIP